MLCTLAVQIPSHAGNVRNNALGRILRSHSPPASLMGIKVPQHHVPVYPEQRRNLIHIQEPT